MKVLRVDRSLRDLPKPAVTPTEGVMLHKDDLLITCAGFEQRSIYSLGKAALISDAGFNVLAIEYLPHMNVNRLSEIASICKQNRAHLSNIKYDRHNPAGFGDMILEMTKAFSGKIYIDISGMSRLLIVQLIVAFLRPGSIHRLVDIIYVEALLYPPNKDEVDQYLLNSAIDEIYGSIFLSSGVYDILVDPDLSSSAMQGQPVRLIAFPSFNTDQIFALRGELQPTYWAMIHGNPPNPDLKWRPTAISKLNRIESLSGVDNFFTNTLNYEETLDCLLDIYDKWGDLQRLLISPTGSKMQAVAVGIFRAFMQDVGIVYPCPKKFAKPKNYTEGIAKMHCVPLSPYSTFFAPSY